MKKLSFFIFAVLFSLILAGQTLSPEQMKQDLKIFREALELRHPEMYRYTDRAKFAELFEKTGRSLNEPLTRKAFYVRMSPLIVALRCGHTKWLIPGKDMYCPFNESDLFPLIVFFTEDKIYVTGTFDGSDFPDYAELLSINGNAADGIRDSLLRCISFADGYSESGKYYQLNNFFPGIYSTYYGSSPDYVVQISEKGAIRTVRLRGVALKQISDYNSAGKPLDKFPFEFRIHENIAAVIDVDRFFSLPGEISFNKFLKTSFRQIKEKGINNLIIDLRGNEGGNENLGIKLYRYIAKSPFRYYDRISVSKKQDSDIDFKYPFIFRFASIFNRKGDETDEFTLGKGLKQQKPVRDNFTGKVYLLLDGQSFSVSAEFASRAKSDGRCTVIGTETAGGYAMNTSGFFTIVNLPNSKIDLGIPLLGFHMADLNDINPKDRGILPDHYVKPTIEQMIINNDYIMKYTLSLIRDPIK